PEARPPRGSTARRAASAGPAGSRAAAERPLARGGNGTELRCRRPPARTPGAGTSPHRAARRPPPAVPRGRGAARGSPPSRGAHRPASAGPSPRPGSRRGRLCRRAAVAGSWDVGSLRVDGRREGRAAGELAGELAEDAADAALVQAGVGGDLGVGEALAAQGQE